MKKESKFPMMLGGQAVIEGVLIRAKDRLAIAVRKPNGKIAIKKDKVHTHPVASKAPLVRGVIMMWDMMAKGVSALNWSAQQQDTEAELGTGAIVISMVFAIAFGIGLFVVAPFFLSKFFTAPGSAWFNLIDGGWRLLIFIAYLAIIGRWKEVKRLFQYHGAEHKAVACFEAGKSLTVSNVQKFSPRHPRCGTALLVIVVAISILVFSVIRTPNIFANLGLRLLFVPLIAGISYELLRFAARKHITFIYLPGLWTQLLTTSEPTNDQVTVAIKAVNAVIKK